VRTEQPSSFTVTVSTAMNRAASYQVDDSSAQVQKRAKTFWDGTKVQTLFSTNGKVDRTYADGTLKQWVFGADPRFEMQAPLLTSLTLSTPEGRKAVLSRQRVVSLANPSNPFGCGSFSARYWSREIRKLGPEESS
jgi:hypothetical protein